MTNSDSRVDPLASSAGSVTRSCSAGAILGTLVAATTTAPGKSVWGSGSCELGLLAGTVRVRLAAGLARALLAGDPTEIAIGIALVDPVSLPLLASTLGLPVETLTTESDDSQSRVTHTSPRARSLRPIVGGENVAGADSEYQKDTMPSSPIDWETILKIVAAGAAAAGALLKILPGAAAAARKQRLDSPSASSLKVLGITALVPWSASLHTALTGTGDEAQAERDRIRGRSKGWCQLGVGICLVFAMFYLIAFALLQTWVVGLSSALALAVACTVGISLRRTLAKIQKNEGQFTGAETQLGSIELIADRAPLEQHALLSLEAIGGRVLRVERCPQSGSMKIFGSIGTRVLPILYLGEFIAISIGRGEFDPTAHLITISSTKLDFFTPSRSRKNIENYLGCWLHFQPARATEQGDRTS